jgi:hypothetical protein
MNNWRDDGMAAHQQQLEEQEQQITGYSCPFCDTIYAISRSDCDGTDIACCGEVGRCTPMTYQELHDATL